MSRLQFAPGLHPWAIRFGDEDRDVERGRAHWRRCRVSGVLTAVPRGYAFMAHIVVVSSTPNFPDSIQNPRFL